MPKQLGLGDGFVANTKRRHMCLTCKLQKECYKEVPHLKYQMVLQCQDYKNIK